MKNFVLVLLGACALFGTAAKAAPINYNFTVDITSGALSGDSFSGDFSFDESAIIGDADEFVDLLSLSFSFQGMVFGLNDGVGEAAFFDGEFLGLSYSVGFPSSVSFSFVPGFFSAESAFFAYEDPAGDGFGDITYGAVSSPQTLFLMVLGLATLIVRRGRI